MLEEKEGADLPQRPTSWTGRHSSKVTGAAEKLRAEIADGIAGTRFSCRCEYFM